MLTLGNSRLKILESSILVANIPSANLGIYPVPNVGIFTVAVSFSEETTFSIRVYDHLSHLILEIKDARTSSGLYEKIIDLRPTASSYYYVEIISANFREVRKVIITK